MHIFRLLRILFVALRYGLEEFILSQTRLRFLETPLKVLLFCRPINDPRAVRLRLALEELGPIFVKFGQMLSTRRDLLPPDLADELARLQDDVPPFSPDKVLEVISQAYGKEGHVVFTELNTVPVASASVAQVHFAKLPDGTPVAVKILRPGITALIEKDLGLMDAAAWMLEKLWADGKRLKPRDVVKEFGRHTHNELDLMLEAANCSQLRRNFVDGNLLLIPEIYWDFCREQVMVMQRMEGTPISQIDQLRDLGIDLQKLALDGVEIFFTQVFRDGFFHADMHPGNILVANDGRYIGLDFGIMGTLTDIDKQYLARNFLAFFRRNYQEVARTHIESGWVPADTRADEFEASIRAVCEPIFDKPLKDISFGRLLLRLFQTSRRFGVEIQPQLVMLQKTLLNIEGLGRELDPELDLWKTAKPFLENWMSKQLGWRHTLQVLREEAPQWGRILPELPRLLHAQLQQNPQLELEKIQRLLAARERRQTRNFWLLLVVLLAVIFWFHSD